MYAPLRKIVPLGETERKSTVLVHSYPGNYLLREDLAGLNSDQGINTGYRVQYSTVRVLYCPSIDLRYRYCIQGYRDEVIQ